MAETGSPLDNRTRNMVQIGGDRVVLSDDTEWISLTTNNEYTIFAAPDKIIACGGESIVYEARRESDGAKVVAKIYDKYAAARDASNRKAVLEFLRKKAKYRRTNIAPLLDEGWIKVPDNNGNEPRLPIDIIPFMETVREQVFSYSQLRNKIIPELLNALNVIHSAGLVHRDIKPDNLYCHEGVFVVADFGITSRVYEGNDSGITETRRATDGYSAPELLLSDDFSSASDYFSLGVTIAALYKGKHLYDNLKKGRLRKAVYEKGLPLQCPAGEEDLQVLVDALIRYKPSERPTFDDVWLWLDDKAAFVAKWYTQEDGKPLGFTFMDGTYNTEKELTEAMLEKWADAQRYLYSEIIYLFFASKKPNLADQINSKIIQSQQAANNHDLGLAMFLHILNGNDCPIYWQGKAYNKPADIAALISRSEADANSITAMLQSGFLSWKFQNNKKSVSPKNIDAIVEIERLAVQHPQLGYYAFQYRFAADSAKDSGAAADNLFRKLMARGHNWQARIEEMLRNDKDFAYLYCHGFKQNVLDLKRTLSGRPFSHTDKESDVMHIYRLFDSICKDKAMVREHYLRYGSLAYLYWLQQNLNLYSFNAPDAQRIAKRIGSVEINNGMNIDEIYNELLRLNMGMAEFMPLFQNNYLLPYLGFRTVQETTGITTRYTYAFFAGEYYGAAVPVGYLRAIGR